MPRSSEAPAAVVRRAPPSAPLPVGVRLVGDAEIYVLAAGRVLFGGSPPRVVRLRPRAAEMVSRWLGGTPLEDRRSDRTVARRLVRAGVLHPRPDPVVPGVLVSVVVPVRDRPEMLQRLLRSLDIVPVIVVDDCSVRAGAVEKVAREAGAEYVRLDRNLGPAGARNAGLARVRSPLVAFVDSDCTVPAGWLDGLIGHFADPMVAAVAPRVVTPPTRSWIGRYEAVRSPLDLGRREGRVAPGSRISYVPTAALVLRRSAVTTPCFDETLTAGEDVDLVWQLAAAGWEIRYDPRVEVTHESEVRTLQWLGRRALYGSSAGPLALRHGDAVAPARVPANTAAVWGLAVSGRPLAAALTGVAATGALASRLAGVVDDPVKVATLLSAGGVARSAAPAVAGLGRAWGPLLCISLFVRPLGRVRAAAAAVLAVTWTRGWRSRPRDLDPARYLGARAADELAYGAGVWWGCLQARTLRPLIPVVTGLRPPRRRAADRAR